MGSHADAARRRIRGLSASCGRPVGLLARIGDHILFYGRALAGMPHAAVHFRREIIRLIAEISMGAGTLAMIGGTVVIVGFLTLAAGGTLAVQGYSSPGQHRHRGVDRLPGGVHQRAYQCAGGGRDRFGRDVRRRGDRPVGGDADQRGDRRPGIDGHPADRIPGVHPHRGRDDRDHPAVLDRGDPVVRGVASSSPWCCSASPPGCTTTTSTRS